MAKKTKEIKNEFIGIKSNCDLKQKVRQMAAEDKRTISNLGCLLFEQEWDRRHAKTAQPISTQEELDRS